MIRKVQFESQERRINQVLAALKENGINSIEEANEICEKAGVDPYQMCEDTQRICFENAKWAYVCGAAIAIKKGVKTAADAAEAIGIGLQSFCIPGSVADDRKVGLGHGNLAARLLREETECFAFLAGHESFAAAEGAIKIAEKANKVRQKPLRVILNGLGKDAAMIISRINGFTYVQTQFDYYTGEVKVVKETPYSDGPRAKVKCYGADDVREGVAILWKENVDVSITGNSTNPTRFQHPVAGTYKKERVLAGKPYFSVASGGGTGRTLHPDNMAAGPASYGMTDTLGRMHSDAQFAGSSSVPAHVEMMGFLGIGNNPMVGATVSIAVGTASRLRPLTNFTPKCLLKIGERPLLQRSMDALCQNGITEFCIVTGYLHEQIEQFVNEHYPNVKVTFIHNADFATTNNIYSLWLARPVADGEEILLLDSDLLYDGNIVKRVLHNEADNVLTLIRHELGEEEMKVVVDTEGSITEISKTCSPEAAAGESLGIEKMGRSYTKALYAELETMMNDEHLENKFYELAFERLLRQGHTYKVLDVSDLFSCELDTVEDFENAKQLIPAELY